MNENIQVFNHQQFGRVRCLDKDGQTWFVGKDVAEALGHKNPSDAIRKHVDYDDKCYEMIVSKPTAQNARLVYKSKTILINESGLYALIFSSKLDTAKAFKHWVTSVVLPQIRKTGGYVPVDAGMTEEEIRERFNRLYENTIGIMKLENAQLQARVKTLTPKAWYSDEVISVNRTYTMTEVARALSMTCQHLTEVLITNKILFRDQHDRRKLHLYAPFNELGLASYRTCLIPDMFHNNDVHTYLVFTEKGKYFISIFMKFGLSQALKAVRA